MFQTRSLSRETTHLSWDSLLVLAFIAFVYYILGRVSTNTLQSIYYFGCAMGILQCLIVHEGSLYIIYFLENHAHVDFSRLFGHIQLAPYAPQVLSGTDDDSGYSEGSEDEKEKDD